MAKTDPSVRKEAAAPSAELVAGAERVFGHVFADKALPLEALTHPSWTCEHPSDPNNQRLEFLGDAVIDLRLAQIVFKKFPDSREGEMTRLRASLASGEALAKKAAALGLGRMLRLGNGEAAVGGAWNTHNLADAFEALVGAICADAGYESAAAAFDALFREEIEALAPMPAGGENPRSALQMLAQRKFGENPSYAVTGETGVGGPNPVFTVRVSAGGAVATGSGRTKRAAAAVAAAALVKELS